MAEVDARELDLLIALNQWALLEQKRGNPAHAQELYEEVLTAFERVGNCAPSNHGPNEPGGADIERRLPSR